MSDGWLPISCVPLRENVIVSDGKRVTIGWAMDQIYEQEGAFDALGDRFKWAWLNATHWMPLPVPPA